MMFSHTGYASHSVKMILFLTLCLHLLMRLYSFAVMLCRHPAFLLMFLGLYLHTVLCHCFQVISFSRKCCYTSLMFFHYGYAYLFIAISFIFIYVLFNAFTHSGLFCMCWCFLSTDSEKRRKFVINNCDK